MKRFYILFALPLFLLFYSCDNSSTGTTFIEASEEKQFVWNGLNLWYFWQEDVPDLADNRFSDDAAFHNYLNGFFHEEDLFESLRHHEDDFSWFIDDYEVHEQARQGISKSFGFRYGIVRLGANSNTLFGYVQYVVEGSPADDAGLKRGDVFNRINGSQLTIQNYIGLLQNETFTLTLSEISGDGFNEINETEPFHSIVLQENPVFFADVIEAGSTKVGYLVYNAFRFNFHEELNNAFGLFKNEQVDELVIDLRYNSGGTLITSAILAGMISGLEKSNNFAKLVYNQKLTDNNTTFNIYDVVPLFREDGSFDREIEMNKLNLSRLFVLTDRGTASASETLMNGLTPYMDVIQIGSVTRGKDEGSITVYDNPPTYNNRNGANPNHMRAMQPVVFKIFNDLDEDYPDGFFPLPENEFLEHHHLETMRQLGDPEELLLARALDIITGTNQFAKIQAGAVHQRFGDLILNSNELEPFYDDMYLLPGTDD